MTWWETGGAFNGRCSETHRAGVKLDLRDSQPHQNASVEDQGFRVWWAPTFREDDDIIHKSAIDAAVTFQKLTEK
ncbi:hypothetical protein chiPu_0008605 [Chiloscyllium punctatum]|uniref:Uncharacterized protein n=1 Tax=Chiloscyllium punctatum TaxID=137246 RepID=A0A401SID3_CHIPU|nr:hypothetical protein [Chiloscyllium punctatum]